MRTEVKAIVAGTVWKIEVRSGARVAEGDVLVVLESMKMEIPITAERAGTVTELWVKEQELVHEGQVIALIQS